MGGMDAGMCIIICCISRMLLDKKLNWEWRWDLPPGTDMQCRHPNSNSSFTGGHTVNWHWHRLAHGGGQSWQASPSTSCQFNLLNQVHIPGVGHEADDGAWHLATHPAYPSCSVDVVLQSEGKIIIDN